MLQRASTSDAFSLSISDGLGLRDGTGSTIAKGFGEAGTAAAAPSTWAAFQARISDSLKYRRAPMINGRGKLSLGRKTQLKIVLGATQNRRATAGFVMSLSWERFGIKSLRVSKAYDFHVFPGWSWELN
jgi:hypothetical protein